MPTNDQNQYHNDGCSSLPCSFGLALLVLIFWIAFLPGCSDPDEFPCLQCTEHVRTNRNQPDIKDPDLWNDNIPGLPTFEVCERAQYENLQRRYNIGPAYIDTRKNPDGSTYLVVIQLFCTP